jgi:hypothetical protein
MFCCGGQRFYPGARGTIAFYRIIDPDAGYYDNATNINASEWGRWFDTHSTPSSGMLNSSIRYTGRTVPGSLMPVITEVFAALAKALANYSKLQ